MCISDHFFARLIHNVKKAGEKSVGTEQESAQQGLEGGIARAGPFFTFSAPPKALDSAQYFFP